MDCEEAEERSAPWKTAGKGNARGGPTGLVLEARSARKAYRPEVRAGGRRPADTGRPPENWSGTAGAAEGVGSGLNTCATCCASRRPLLGLPLIPQPSSGAGLGVRGGGLGQEGVTLPVGTPERGLPGAATGRDARSASSPGGPI